jgi:hypothetical protein
MAVMGPGAATSGMATAFFALARFALRGFFIFAFLAGARLAFFFVRFATFLILDFFLDFFAVRAMYFFNLSCVDNRRSRPL